MAKRTNEPKFKVGQWVKRDHLIFCIEKCNRGFGGDWVYEGHTADGRWANGYERHLEPHYFDDADPERKEQEQ